MFGRDSTGLISTGRTSAAGRTDLSKHQLARNSRHSTLAIGAGRVNWQEGRSRAAACQAQEKEADLSLMSPLGTRPYSRGCSWTTSGQTAAGDSPHPGADRRRKTTKRVMARALSPESVLGAAIASLVIEASSREAKDGNGSGRVTLTEKLRWLDGTRA